MSALGERSAAHARPAVVQFHASWCGPCRAIAPHVAALEQEFAGRVDVWRVDVDEDPDAARELGVRGVPTLVVLAGGREVLRRSGFAAPGALRTLFRAALGDVSAEAASLAVAGASNRRKLPAAGLGFVLVLASGMSPWSGPLAWAGTAFLFWGMSDACPLCQAGTRGIAGLWNRSIGRLLRRAPG